MTAIQGTTLKKDLKNVCSRACEGEVFIISRPREQNVVLLSEEEFSRLKRMEEYYEKMSLGKGDSGSAESTYPPGFFSLFGSGSEDGFDIEPEELDFDMDIKRVSV